MIHIWDTTSTYLTYSMTSEVSIHLEYEFLTPSLGLCFLPNQFVLLGACEANLATIDDIDDCYRADILYRMSLKDIATNSSSELISRVENDDNNFNISSFFKFRMCLDVSLHKKNLNLSMITQGDAEHRRVFLVRINLKEYFIHDSVK